MYFDYDTVKRQQTDYETATTFWAMWAGLASPHQAAALVVKALPKFEEFGGLVSGTAESRGAVGIDRFVHLGLIPSYQEQAPQSQDTLRAQERSPLLISKSGCSAWRSMLISDCA